ncbi:MAG: extracellular solute-binding protein [Lachnospiraceae bacterium]|jgi:raffinose/stachyose/melibiose transport system substrate-binding protein|nr:extracellular solute-binding protein [Lachnospiraceae bacterium]
MKRTHVTVLGKRALAVALGVVCAVGLAACGSGSGSGAAATTAASGGGQTAAAPAPGGGDDKTIEFWHIATEGGHKVKVEAAIEKFNSTTQSGYKVVGVPIQNDTYKEKLVIAMSSGECPDAYVSWSGGPMNEYINSGFARELDALFDATPNKDKYLEGALAQGRLDGKLYGIPYHNTSISGVFYNTEIFAKYGLEEPKTLEDLEKICDTLLENDIIPFALANGSKWTGSMYFMSLAARKGGLEPFQKAVAGEGTFEDAAFIYAGEKIQEWVKKGYFPEGVNSLSEDDGQAKQLMYQEAAGMLLCGSWYTGTFSDDSKEFYAKVNWFSFPEITGSGADPKIQIGTVGDQFISMNCDGDKLKAAVEFATIFSDDDMIQVGIDNGTVPPFKGVVDQLTDPCTVKIMQAAADAPEIQLWYDQYLPPAVATAHLDGSQEIFGLTKTPEQAAKMMQDAMAKYNSESK